jgi:pimeloyl-ACP methyl ester carboxylesterase
MKSTDPYTIHGNGPLVILLHSSMSSKDQWLSLVTRLKSDFTLLSIDLSGYGASPFPENPDTFSIADEIKIITDILCSQFRDTKRFHLVGHSYGGAIALNLAHLQAEHLKTLTLFEPVAFHLLKRNSPSHLQVTGIVNKLTELLKDRNKVEATKTFIDYWSGEGTFDNLNRQHKGIFISYIDKVQLDFKALFNETLAVQNYSTPDRPTCLIKGEKSPISSLEIFDILSHSVKGSMIHTVKGGHMSPITHVKEVNQIIETFLRSFR